MTFWDYANTNSWHALTMVCVVNLTALLIVINLVDPKPKKS